MPGAICLRSVLVLFAVVVGAGGAAGPVSAQDGAYVLEPWRGSYYDVKIQAWDQKIVAGGPWYDDAGGGWTMARYDFDALPDATYGSDGVTMLPPWSNGGVHSLVIQSDGKAVATGAFGNNSALGVARFNLNGSLDSGFGSGGTTSLTIPNYPAAIGYGIGLQSTGKIVAGGIVYSPVKELLARFTASGALDSGKNGFGQTKGKIAAGYTLNSFTGPDGGYGDLVVQPDDKIVLIESAAGTAVVARYTVAGKLDTSFNGTGYKVFVPPAGIYFVPVSVALQGEKIVVAGRGSGGMIIVRFNSNGTLDTGFGGTGGLVQFGFDGSSEGAYDLVLQPDGKIVAVGYSFTSPVTIPPGAQSQVLVVRFHTDGTLDTDFGTGGFKLGGSSTAADSFFGLAVDLQIDGSIIVAGYNEYYDETNDSQKQPLLMRFDP